MIAPLSAPTAPGIPGAAPVTPAPAQGASPVNPTSDQLAARVAATTPATPTVINRPILTPAGTTPASTTPAATPATGTPAVPAPQSVDEIYANYVKQGQSTLDAINATYDNAVKASDQAIDAPASNAQQNNNALAAASGLLGSSAAIGGSNAIATKAGADKATADAALRTKQAGDVASYLSQLQQAAQTEANTEKTQYPTLDAYYKSQAGTAFQGLASSGVDWDKFSSNPDYASAYNSVISAFGGDPNMAKLAFIAASKAGTKSQYLNQDPIQAADGSWIFLKQTTNPDGTTTITPDKVDVGSALPQGTSLTTMGGKPYSVTKAADGTISYKPIDTTSSTAAQGFTLGTNQVRYELDPDTGQYKVVGNGPAPAAGGSTGNFDITTLDPSAQTELKSNGFTNYNPETQSLAQDLVTGNMAPDQASKRSTGTSPYNDILTAAKQYALATTGKPFDLAEAERQYKFSTNVQTQNTLNYLGSLVGGNGTTGNLDELVNLSNGLTRTSFPSLNDAAAWARINTGDPTIAAYQATATEVADQVAKILQGGGTGSGTSDAKLAQANALFQSNFSKAQLLATVNALRPLLANRAKSMIGNNPYLSTYADQFGFTQDNGTSGAGSGGGNISSQAAAAGLDYNAMKADGYTDDQIQQAIGQ